MKFIVSSLILVGIIAGGLYGYTNYKDDIRFALFDEPHSYQIFVNTVGIEVTVADTAEERRQGLSGTEALGELEGKLFIFDVPDTYGIWMKDMNYPIDILWIDENLTVVYVVEAATPDSYPTVFRSATPARFVLETKASFASFYKIEVGDTITLPPGLIPEDLRRTGLE